MKEIEMDEPTADNLKLLKIDDFLEDRQCVHIVKAQIRHDSPLLLHTHDFCEVFWVIKGKGKHLINGQNLPLRQGDMVFIREKDCHSFSVANGEELDILNISFPAKSLALIRERYFSGRDLLWSMSEDLPQCKNISDYKMNAFKKMASDLYGRKDSLIALDAFLLSLYDISLDSVLSFENSPLWLQKACELMSLPEHFSKGSVELSRLANKSQEHVSRLLKKTTGLGVATLVNHHRMQYAAKELLISKKEIPDISLECGFDSLGHFYQVFKKAYQTSPQKYRLENRSIF